MRLSDFAFGENARLRAERDKYKDACLKAVEQLAVVSTERDTALFQRDANSRTEYSLGSALASSHDRALKAELRLHEICVKWTELGAEIDHLLGLS